MTKFASIAVAALGAALLPAAAHAQTAPAPAAAPALAAAPAAQTAPTTGATVYDGSGVEVGKIEGISGGNAVVFTGTNRATIPLTSFGTSPKGPTLGMTKAELDAAAAQAGAAAAQEIRSKIVAGAPVHGTAGAVLANVRQVNGDQVVLATAKGSAVSVPIAGIGSNEQGLFVSMTQAEFDAAVAATAPAKATKK